MIKARAKTNENWIPTLTRKRRSAVAATIGLVLLSLPGVCAGASNGKKVRIRLAFSESVFLNVSENNARAALGAWAEAFAKTSNVEIDSAQLMRSEDIVHAIANHLLDGFSITTPEYAKVARYVDPVIFTDQRSARGGLDYVLLVRKDSGIHDLKDLRGRSLVAHQHVSTSLASVWLETLLAASNFGAVDRFFGQVTKVIKVSQAVLPVFFGRADACVVTRRAFDTMSELNPQLRQQLEVIAASPKVLTGFVAVHKDSSLEIKSAIRQAVVGLDDTPSGHQLLILFESQRLIPVDTASLRGSLDLLEAYDRLKTGPAAGGTQ